MYVQINPPMPPIPQTSTTVIYVNPADFAATVSGWDGKTWPPPAYNQVPPEAVMNALHNRIKELEATTSLQATQIKLLQEHMEELMLMIYPQKAAG